MSDVNVEFGAQLGQLLTGLKQATDGVKSFAEQGKAAIAGLTTPFEKLQSTLLAVAAIAAGGAVFKSMIDGALESTSTSLRLAKTFGMTLESASELRVELAGLGISAEDYTSMALRMDRQLRTNESSLKAMGLATRDSNGHLLGQQDLLRNGVEWLRTFKEGADRNIAAQTLFGRNIGEVNSLLKMSSETAKKAKQDMKDLGLVTTAEDVARSKEYKLAMNQLQLAFEGIRDAIGSAVLPYLSRFAQWFREVTPTLIANMKTYAKDFTSFALDLLQSIGNFAITVWEMLDKTGSKFDNLSTKASAVAGGALGGAIGGGLVGGPVGAVAGAVGGGVVGALASDLATKDTALEAEQKHFEEIRKKWAESIEKFRKMLESGGPEMPAAGAAPAKGTKSADFLIQMQDQVKAMQSRIEQEIKALQAGLALKKQIFDMEVSFFGKSQDEKFAKLQSETQKEFQLELAKLEQEKRIGGLSLAQRQEVENKIKDLKIRNTAAMVQLDIQSLESMKARYMEIFDQISSSFNGQLRGLLAGTTKWKDALKAIFADLIVWAIGQFAKMGLQWVATQLAMTTATTTGAAARAAAEASGNVAGSTASYGEAIAQVVRSSVQTFAGVFANLAPVMGPAAAGPAAAAQATVAASVAELPPPFELGAFSIPRTMQALLHPEEMVLPAPFANAVRSMITGGGSSGGDVFQIQAVDSRSFEQLLMRNGASVVRALKKQARQN